MRQVDQALLGEVLDHAASCLAPLGVPPEKHLWRVNISPSTSSARERKGKGALRNGTAPYLDVRSRPTVPRELEGVVGAFLARLGQRHEVFDLVYEVEFSQV